eukprot:m51a1_g6201 hypothetical protein (83) ;mRNA; r:120032-121535
MDSPRPICTESRARKRPDVKAYKESESARLYKAQQQRAFRLLKAMAVQHGAQVFAVTVSRRAGVSTCSSMGCWMDDENDEET